MNNEDLTSVNTTDNTVNNTPAQPEALVEETTPVVNATTPPVETPAAVDTTVPTDVTPAPVATETISPASATTEAPVETVTPEATTVNPTNGVNTTPPTSDITAATITPPTLETPKDPNVKKKSKTPIIIIAVVVVILLILAAVFYFTQYQTKESRIESITKSLFGEITEFVNQEKQEISNKESGTYTFSASGSVSGDALGGTEYSANAKIDGNYGLDLENKDTYATIKIEDLVLLKESLIGSNAIETDVEISNDTLYIVLKDMFDQTITEQNESFAEIFDSIESAINGNDSEVDPIVIINAYRDALTSALNAMDSTQSVKSGSIGLHNAVNYNLTNANLKKANDAFYNSLSNNSEFIKEMAKLTNTDETTYKEELTSEYEETEGLDDQNFTLEIATSLTGGKLLGVFVEGKDTSEFSCNKGGSISYEVVPVDNGYKYTQVNPTEGNYSIELTKTTEGSKNVITVKVSGKTQDYDKEYKDDYSGVKSCTNDGDTKIDGTIKIEITNEDTNKAINLSLDGTYTSDDSEGNSSSVAAKLEVSASRTIDATYTDSTIDKKNTIAYEDLTEEQLATIEASLEQKLSGLSSLLSSFIGSSSYDDDDDYSYSSDDDWSYSTDDYDYSYSSDDSWTY